MIRQQAITLTHWGRVTHICVGKLTIIGSDNGWSAPSHYLNQCWNIVNSNLRNKLQWNPRQNSFIFIQENAFENVVCNRASIQSRSQWVNPCWPIGVIGVTRPQWKNSYCRQFLFEISMYSAATDSGLKTTLAKDVDFDNRSLVSC